MKSFYQVIISCNWYNFMITQRDTAENHRSRAGIDKISQESHRFWQKLSADGGFLKEIFRSLCFDITCSLYLF